MEKILQNKVILILITTVLGLGTLFIFFNNHKISEKNQKEITLVIDYGDGTKRQFRGDGVTFMEDENAWSVLQRAAATASIPLEVARGFYPIVINGKRNGEEGKRWVFYVNGERQSNGVPLEIAIKEGDEVVWKFE